MFSESSGRMVTAEIRRHVRRRPHSAEVNLGLLRLAQLIWEKSCGSGAFWFLLGTHVIEKGFPKY